MSDDRALQITKDLIRCPSISPTDVGARAVVITILSDLGFVIEPIEKNGILSLWAQLGTAKPLFCFAGHTDVVPTGDLAAWTSPPFEPTVRDGMLYGRGAADMKGGVGCFLAALERYLKANGTPKNFSIGVLIAGDEEDNVSEGTVLGLQLLASRGQTIDYCIVAEPTCTSEVGDTIKNGRRGSATGFLTVKGIQGHSAYPQLAKNPIHAALPALTELMAVEWDQGTPDFPQTTLQITNIKAGAGATNVIPGVLEANFNIRFSNLHTSADFERRCGEIFARHGFEYTVTWVFNADPFLTTRGGFTDIVADAVKRTLDRSPEFSTSGGTSDARFIAAPHTQVVELGLINKTIHAINEHVSVESISKLTDVFVAVLENVASTHAAG